MKLWLREIDLMMGNKSFTNETGEGGFSIDFRVPFSTSKDPDISEITIKNLSKSTISSIKSRAYVVLNAGYKGNIGNILTGKIEDLSSRWESTDKVTTIKVSDGGFEWRKARIQKTYAKGSASKYIMQDLAGMIGLEVVEISPKKDIVYQLGKTVTGSVESNLKQLTKDTESKMYINKGKLYIRDKNKGTQTGFLLNSDKGLIGSPERQEEEDEKGNKIIKYKVSCLLNHKITTDSIIKIESRTINGTYRVESGSHNGDFITEMTVVPV